MFYLYVLENPSGKLYIGQTQNLQKRVKDHNPSPDDTDLKKFTHKHGPWTLIGYETFNTRSEAMLRERQLKRWKSPSKVRALFR